MDMIVAADSTTSAICALSGIMTSGMSALYLVSVVVSARGEFLGAELVRSGIATSGLSAPFGIMIERLARGSVFAREVQVHPPSTIMISSRYSDLAGRQSNREGIIVAKNRVETNAPIVLIHRGGAGYDISMHRFCVCVAWTNPNSMIDMVFAVFA